MRPTFVRVGVLALVPLLTSVVSAAPGGKGGGKPGGGGGGGGPPAPAIVYTQNDPNETHLMVMDNDGGNPTVILANALAKFSIGTNLNPSVSPDGSTVVFWSNRDGGSSLFTIDVDGTSLQPLVSTNGWTLSQDWSPVPLADGNSWIAYTDGVDGLDVQLVRPDGSGLFNLTNTPNLDETDPTWSPDGTQLAVIGHGGTPYRQDLLVYDIGLVSGLPAVTGVTNLTSDPGHPLASTSSMLSCDWSQDGSRLTVAAMLPSDSNADLWVVDLANPLAAINITQSPTVNEMMPCWSPDDLEIVFFRNRGTKKLQGLNTLFLDGSGGRWLGAPDGLQPDWFAH